MRLNGKTSLAIIAAMTLIAAIGTWGIVVAVADGKDAPGGLCTIVGTAIGGLAGALAQLTRRNGSAEYGQNRPMDNGQSRH